MHGRYVGILIQETIAPSGCIGVSSTFELLLIILQAACLKSICLLLGYLFRCDVWIMVLHAASNYGLVKMASRQSKGWNCRQPHHILSIVFVAKPISLHLLYITMSFCEILSFVFSTWTVGIPYIRICVFDLPCICAKISLPSGLDWFRVFKCCLLCVWQDGNLLDLQWNHLLD